MRKLKNTGSILPFSLSLALYCLSACAQASLSSPFIAIENQENIHSITPRTKGTTYLTGTIVMPPSFTHSGFEVFLRQNDLPLSPASIRTDTNGTFSVEALSVTQDMPLYIEARSMDQPQVILIHEIMLTEKMPAELPVEISVETTAAVYTARYLNVPSQSPEALLDSPELLEPVKAMLETHFISSPSTGNGMDMPAMNASLEKARIMWMKLHNQETTP
jgi:hypothetical protein